MIGQDALGTGDGTIINNRRLVASALFQMQIHGIKTNVGLSPGKPSVERGIGIIQNLVPFFIPVHLLRDAPPEFFRIGTSTAVDLVKGFSH